MRLKPGGRAAIVEFVPNPDRDAAGCGSVQRDDAGDYACRRCVHVCRAGEHGEERRVRAGGACAGAAWA